MSVCESDRKILAANHYFYAGLYWHRIPPKIMLLQTSVPPCKAVYPRFSIRSGKQNWYF